MTSSDLFHTAATLAALTGIAALAHRAYLNARADARRTREHRARMAGFAQMDTQADARHDAVMAMLTARTPGAGGHNGSPDRRDAHSRQALSQPPLN